MTDNYIGVEHVYFSNPTDEGQRLRTKDVWYAVRPSPPGFAVVDNKDDIIDEQEASVSVSWTIHCAARDPLTIADRDDINGLRLLLDAIEMKMDQEDMEALHASLDITDESE